MFFTILPPFEIMPHHDSLVTIPSDGSSDNDSTSSSNSSSTSSFSDSYQDQESLLVQCKRIRKSVEDNAPYIEIASSISEYIDNSIDLTNKTWRGRLTFLVHKRLPQNSTSSFLPDNVNKDIIKYVGSQDHNQSTFHFPQDKYSSVDGFNGTGFSNLVKDLQRASLHSGGFHLNRNGKKPLSGNPNGCFRLKCRRCQLYRGKVTQRSNLSFKQVTFSNQRKNNRQKQKGLSLPRRTKTKLPLHHQNRCRFFFVLSYDENGFYVVNGKGNPIHSYHSKLPSGNRQLPPRLIEETQLQIIRDLSKASASLGVMRNTMHVQTGAMYSISNLYHIRKVCGVLTDIEFQGTKYNTIDVMIKFFEENKYEYTMLSHNPEMNGIVNLRVTHPYTSSENSTISFPGTESDEVTSFVSDRRSQFGVKSDQQLMMAIAWTIPHETNLFHFFPSVIFVDTTMDTNKENRPLLSLVGRDTNGKAFTLLRVYLPNQQLWVFRWVFCVLLP